MTSERPDPSRPEEPEPKLDVDAAFAEIVAHWEPSAPGADEVDHEDEVGGTPDPSDPRDTATDAPSQDRTEPPESPAAPTARREADPERLRGIFRPSWSDPLDDQATWADEGHFVPPPPPPLPRLDPRRKIAWGALLGSPVLALVLLVIGWPLPGWALVGMVVSFVGGFCYLVATMSSSDHDGWSDGNGAVV
jgi:hypothetical protein